MTDLAKTFVILLLLFAACEPKEEEITSLVTRQVIPGELPDPSMIEVNGTYYATGSSNDWGPFYPIYQSKDLKNWDFVDYVFREKPDWTVNSFWAPELFYSNGKFYCYYTARRVDGVSCIGVASTDDISKGFEDHGVIIEWGNEAIDAFVYQEEEELYITWKAYGLTEDKPIQLLGSKLSKDGLSLEGDAFEVLTAEADSWEKGGIEGQTILKRDGYLYMLYSGNACCGANCDYQVGVARAKTMEGPWEKYEGNPILVGNESWKCPGHGTALQKADDWFYLYHAYPASGFPNIGRTVLLSQIEWNQGNGWPYFKAETDRGLLIEDFRDEFEGDELNAIWRFDVGTGNASYEVSDGKLELKVEGEGVFPAFLGINPAVASGTFETVVSRNGDALQSLTFYATRDNNLGLGVKGDSLILWKQSGGNWEELVKLKLEPSDQIHLRAQMKEGKEFDFAYSLDGESWTGLPEKVQGDNLAWWSWGMKAGVSVKAESGSKDQTGWFEKFEVRY
ncbi:family 43 glycosylhydrolase [Algoriphagus vanfongensis]|uniref:family 43 glycosylhydrolase n=1 Tax=Algoriphagus vanfongensis TaxID=426371 RepID=UPI00040BBAAB|nr:family 43 glycosylhydrolase [Algoriphagus vanfongensis]